MMPLICMYDIDCLDYMSLGILHIIMLFKGLLVLNLES